jgi:hypothetical protein
VGAVAAAAAVEAAGEAPLPVAAGEEAVVGSPGVVLLLPEASAAARVVLPVVVAPAPEGRQG